MRFFFWPKSNWPKSASSAPPSNSEPPPPSNSKHPSLEQQTPLLPSNSNSPPPSNSKNPLLTSNPPSSSSNNNPPPLQGERGGNFKDVRFYPILNFGLFGAALFKMSVFYTTRNVRQFWADPTFSAVRSTFFGRRRGPK